MQKEHFDEMHVVAAKNPIFALREVMTARIMLYLGNNKNCAELEKNVFILQTIRIAQNGVFVCSKRSRMVVWEIRWVRRVFNFGHDINSHMGNT